MKPLKEKISITVDGDVLDIIRAEAENDDRSLSQFINIVLKEHIKKNKKIAEPAGVTKRAGAYEETDPNI